MPIQDRKDEALVRRAFAYFAVLSAGLMVVVVVGAIVVAGIHANRSAGGGWKPEGGRRAAVQVALGDPDQEPTSLEFIESIENAAMRAGVRSYWSGTTRAPWPGRPVWPVGT